MFKAHLLSVICSLVVLMNAAPIDKDSEAKILNNEFTIDEKGNYRFSFQTSNGLMRQETGSIVNEGQPNEHLEVNGLYTYIDSEGQTKVVIYSAGENGFILPPTPVFEMTTRFGSPPQLVASLLGK